jgi:hypothetical protein
VPAGLLEPGLIGDQHPARLTQLSGMQRLLAAARWDEDGYAVSDANLIPGSVLSRLEIRKT